jgi:hypothetical protein
VVFLDKFIREAIAEILKNRADVFKIAIRQKAKFEGWLKFELASYLEKYGMENVEVEAKAAFRKERSDISFFYNDNPYRIELKTPNSNWKSRGIVSSSRPITDNIGSIIGDTYKLNSQYGIVAFVLFPIPTSDDRWNIYLKRIMEETKIELSKEKNCTVINQTFGNEINCDMVICTYMSKYYGLR